MTDLDKVRDELAHAHESQHLSNPNVFTAGWNALLKILSEAAGEFDGAAFEAEANARIEEMPDMDSVVAQVQWMGALMRKMARWQFEQGRMRIGLAEGARHYMALAMNKSDAREIEVTEKLIKQKYKNKQFEARLQESERLRIEWCETIREMKDKLSSAEQRCKELERLTDNAQENVIKATARIKELEAEREQLISEDIINSGDGT